MFQSCPGESSLKIWLCPFLSKMPLATGGQSPRIRTNSQRYFQRKPKKLDDWPFQKGNMAERKQKKCSSCFSICIRKPPYSQVQIRSDDQIKLSFCLGLGLSFQTEKKIDFFKTFLLPLIYYTFSTQKIGVKNMPGNPFFI